MHGKAHRAEKFGVAENFYMQGLKDCLPGSFAHLPTLLQNHRIGEIGLSCCTAGFNSLC